MYMWTLIVLKLHDLWFTQTCTQNHIIYYSHQVSHSTHLLNFAYMHHTVLPYPKDMLMFEGHKCISKYIDNEHQVFLCTKPPTHSEKLFGTAFLIIWLAPFQHVTWGDVSWFATCVNIPLWVALMVYMFSMISRKYISDSYIIPILLLYTHWIERHM